MSFDGVLLDFDNTLYHYESAHKPALSASIEFLCQKSGLPCDTISDAYRTARSEINKELEGQAASHSRLLYFQRLNEILGLNPCATVLDAEEIYWSAFLEEMRLRPGVMDFLDSIVHIPFAIVTDLTAQIQFRKLAKLGLDKRLRAVVTSEEVGAEKPAAIIFQSALNKLDIKAERACVIGDSWDRDILGGIRLGIRSFWLRDERTPQVATAGVQQQRKEAPTDKSVSALSFHESWRELVVEFSSFDELKKLMEQF